jgi:phospholipid:diacylglycerol acyltransferase
LAIIVQSLSSVDSHAKLHMLTALRNRSFFNLEVRDRYFSRLRATIELNLKINRKKTVLVSHSMGGPLLLVRARSDLWLHVAPELTFRPGQWFFK